MANRTPKTPAMHRKSESARRANQVIRGRTLLLMMILGVVTFALLFWKLYDLQINQYDEMTARAVHQQTQEHSVTASRGTIYDKNHNILASSTTAETVCLNPLQIDQFVKSQEKAQDEAAAKALEKGQTYTRQPIRDQSYIARGLSRILGIEQEKIEREMEKTKFQYIILRRKRSGGSSTARSTRRGTRFRRTGSAPLPASSWSRTPSAITPTTPWRPMCWALWISTTPAPWVWRSSITATSPAPPV